jgi:catechol 2,3-dioxygenase-like lactoylglutathione lyase family enzyme
MPLFQPYHAGFVVPDLEAAVADFEARLGYSFNPPTTLGVHEVEDRVSGRTGPTDMRVTYSRQGPFRLEVIEAHGDGIYAVGGPGIHHLGVWEADVAGRLKQLEADGDPVDAVLRQKDGSISVVYARSTVLPDTRIEYVSEAQRERLERWFDGAPLA